MKIENRQQLLAVLALGMVGLLILINVVGAPMVAGWKKRAKDIAELRATITRGESSLSRVQTVRDRWEQMRTNSLSADNAERKMLEAFQKWSSESKISVSSIQPQWKRNEEDHMTLECHANAFGSMSALAQFLYNIEKDPTALRIESMEITSRDETGQTLALALQVSSLVLSPPPQ